MPFFRRQRRPFAVLALLAMWLLALAPVASRAQAWAERAAPWQAVCTADPDTAGDPAPEPGSIDHLVDHCPFCGLALQAFAPPPAGACIPARPAAVVATLTTRSGVPSLRPVRTPSVPRGPPSSTAA